MLERLFCLKQNKTDVRTEVVAGITTFMTMAYIIVVNPLLLSGASSGPGMVPTVTATCIGAAIPTLLMGLWANYPIALASGMGLNAAVVAAVASSPGITWQAMMGVIFAEGIIITLLVLTGLRELVMRAIPMDLKRAIGVGIGLLIAVLGFHNGHWMSSTSPVGGMPLIVTPIGNFHVATTLLATFGILLTAWLVTRGTKGALLIGIVATTLVAFGCGMAKPPTGVMAAPQFDTFGKLDLSHVLQPALLAMVFAFLITDFFDTMGTVIGIGEQAGHLQPDGSLPRLNRVLLVDSLAAAWGGLCSASSVTSYIESASGVSEGGRTGLTSVVCGLLFVLAMFFAPLVQSVPSEATAAALIIVGFLMIRMVKDIDFTDMATAIPVFLIILVIPLTSSISRGIGTGFISYVALKTMSGKPREVPVAMWALAVLFAVSFWLERAS